MTSAVGNEGKELIKICESECNCCGIDKIYTSIKEHAKQWKEMEETKFAVGETPLHRAAAAGKTEMAVELLNLMPSLGRKLDREGWSPLHLAIERAHRETAGQMAKFDKQLVRVKGRKGITPLMLCAAKADNKDDLELLARLLVACPEAVEDVNNDNQTVVHVALEKQRCRAVCVLVDWLQRRDKIASVLPVKDYKGNTALHAAAQFGCAEGAQKIVGLVKLNRLNTDKKTALNVAIENKQTAVADILKNKGAKKNDEISPAETTTNYVLSKVSFPEKLSRFYYSLTQELTLEMRNAILVVATLIVAATYQGVLQPPGGLYPPPDPADPVPPRGNSRLLDNRHHMGRRLVKNDDAKHLAGRMVMEEAYYRYFMPSNTFAFALSTVIIIFVVPSSPVFLILHFCLIFMCLSYLLALDAISKYTGISHMIYGMALYAILGAYYVKLFYYPVKALLVEEDWWLRRISIVVANCTSSRATRGFPLAVVRTAHKVKKQYQVLSLQ